MDYENEINKGRKGNGKYLYNDTNALFLSTSNVSIKIRDLKDNDELFNAYMKTLQIDGEDIYNKNVLARYSKKRDAAYLARQGEAKYVGEANRLSFQEKNKKENKLASEIYELYKEKPHKELGIARMVESPLAREARSKANIDIIFNNGNKIYICELKDIDNKKSLLIPISEILTYYFCNRKHIEEDGVNKYFYKQFTYFDESSKYEVIPAIIVPESMVSSSKLFLPKLIEKIKDYDKSNPIDFKCFVIAKKDGIIDIKNYLQNS